MKKNLLKLLIVAMLAVILTSALVACNGTTIQKVDFTITFDVDGENYFEIKTPGSEVLQMPTNPAKENYIFDGWYWDKDEWQRPFTANSLANQPLTDNLTVYAKWTEVELTQKIFTVSFNSMGGSLVDNAVVKYGSHVNKPANPTKSGYIFAGWYRNADTTDKWEFVSDTVTEDLTLYAKWVDEADAAGCEILVATGLSEKGGILSATVPNAQENFVLSSAITVSPEATWNVSSDIGGNSVISSATIPLSVGDNTYYINVTSGNGFNKKQYTVKIHRRAIYTVTYEPNNGEGKIIERVEEDNTLENKTVQKTGYTFGAWQYDGAPWDFNTVVSFDLTLSASWTAKTYHITFDSKQGNAVETTDVTYDSDFEFEVPIRKGFIFNGWKTDGGALLTDDDGKGKNVWTIDDSVTLTADWTAIEYTITYHNAENATNDNETVYTLEVATIVLSDASKAGYTFLGWFDAQEDGTKVIEIETDKADDIDLWARWQIIEYTATFKAENGIVDTVPFTVEDEVLNRVPTVPEKEGYTGHWEDYTIKPQDITINAIYEIKKFTVTWKNYDGKILKTDHDVPYGSTPTYTGETPYKGGDTYKTYSFFGWLPKVEGIVSDMEYVAQFILSTSGDHTISYDANGGTGAPEAQTKKSGQTLKLRDAIPQNGANIFMGWECALDGKIYSAGSDFALDANITLYAVWGHECDVCSGSGNVTEKIQCNACSGKGYTTQPGWFQCSSCKGTGHLSYQTACSSCRGFGGTVLCTCANGHNWYANQTGSRICPYCGKSGSGSRLTTCSTCSGSGTVTAYKDCTACSGKGGSSYEQRIDCPSCDNGYNSYSHKCTTCQGEKYVRNESESSTVTLNVGTGASKSASVEFGHPYRLFVPARIGYTFVGWFDVPVDGIRYTDSEGISLGVWNDRNGKTLYAHWDLVQYTITYECDDESIYEGVLSSYTVEDDNIVLPVPKQDYYEFVWRIDGQRVSEIDTDLAKNITVRGEWVPIEYHITYELDDGTAENESTYTVESAEIKLNAPTKTGYTFLGWSSESLEGLQLEVTIPAGAHGDLTFVAHWKINQYTITFETNGGEDLDVMTLDYDSIIELQKPFYFGKSFVGWYDESLTHEVVLDRMPAENITVYAKWIDYKVTLSYEEIFVIGVEIPLDASAFNATAVDTDGNSVDIIVTITDGQKVAGSSITVHITATGLYGISDGTTMTLSVLGIGESELLLYKNGDLIETRRIYKGEEYTLPKEEGCNVAWHLGDTILTDANGHSLTAWNYESNRYELTTEYYTIHYELNGGDCNISSQLVNVDAEYTLAVPTRVGYTFNGWFHGNTQYHSGTWTEKSDVTLTAHWIADNNTKYTVHHYQQNLEDDLYTLFESDTLSGETDTYVTPNTKDYSGFKVPTKQRIQILPDGTAELSYYYDRLAYDLTVMKNDGTTTSMLLKYEAVLETSVELSRDDFTFGGYYSDPGLNNEVVTMPAKALTVYVWWTEETKAYHFTYSGSSTITITKYDGEVPNVRIPEYIGNIPVRSIGSYAFSGQTKVTTLIINDGVTSIGSNAFEGMKITSIVIPDSVTSMGSGVFMRCNSLTEITLPFVGGSRATYSSPLQHSDSEDERLFGYIFGSTTEESDTKNGTNLVYQGQYQSRSYRKYYIPDSLKSVTITDATGIYAYAFYNCTKLTSITLNGGITKIYDYAFYNCNALQSINIPSGITSIADYVFYNTALTSITIPSGVKSIGYYAFYGAPIGEIELPSGLQTIGKYAFYGNTAVSTITIPASVSSIGSYAFSGQTKVTTLIINDGVTSIGSNAFEGMKITSIVIPDSVTSMGSGVFMRCNSLTEITLPFVGGSRATYSSPLQHSDSEDERLFGYIFGSTTEESDTKNGTNLVYQGQTYQSRSYRKYYIPDSLKSVTITDATGISAYAFYNCTKLTSVTLNSEITNIYDYAFYNCTGLVSINYSGTIDAWTEISKGSSWDGSSGNYTVYCTDGTIAKDGTETRYDAQNVPEALPSSIRKYDLCPL